MIEFYKMSGSGNDFILIDNRGKALNDIGIDLKSFAKSVCRNKVSVGADGLIIIEPSDKADFRWIFFNADGSEAEMCGNGGRCAARFALLKGIAGKKLSFETKAGIIDAEVKDDIVKLRLTDPRDLKLDYSIPVKGGHLKVNSINTGVPHVVSFVDRLNEFDVFGYGRDVRYHSVYAPAGTNVNFVKMDGKNRIQVRTYERGVEDETLACGTGAVASALVGAGKRLVDSPVEILVKSGEILNIYFDISGDRFSNVYLEGKASVVYEGRLWKEAY